MTLKLTYTGVCGSVKTRILEHFMQCNLRTLNLKLLYYFSSCYSGNIAQPNEKHDMNFGSSTARK